MNPLSVTVPVAIISEMRDHPIEREWPIERECPIEREWSPIRFPVFHSLRRSGNNLEKITIIGKVSAIVLEKRSHTMRRNMFRSAILIPAV